MTSTSPADLAVATVVPVSDMARSRAFYEETLGLAGEPVPGGGTVLRAGGGTLLYLMSDAGYAGQAGWPLASFRTHDLPGTVADLRERGVVLESMDGEPPWRTDERGIADFGDVLIAWFRDPDGQVISVVQPTP
ncbi:glyoxalase/bleomycin resistance protein/dioxygenase superfamily protein [Actinomycetospora succinea]|uniref:Glyoxalase/bleomycin resistance protein/dioxygenase superfamily protein n=1 Tax=Actinomycetospora succinea TaxID=663603 RepID=A0A4R6V8N4_9PSEU|nr:VOC family protein [Actinomycetospora succinea]TDQ52738.1 glyoxalase/bleomycin resistance protein/dioxygenase superfamily protein [Actinomycetospora succinea]